MGNMTNFSAKHLERKANNRAARKVTIIDCSKVLCYKEKALNEPIVLPRILIRTILSRKCNGCTPNVPCDPTVIMPSLYLHMSFYPSPLKRNKTSNRRLIPKNEDVLSLPFWGHSGWRRQARRWLSWKTRKKLHLFFGLALRFSGKPGWKMEDWGSRMKERGSGIKDHPFTDKKNFLHNSKYKAWYRGVGKRQKNTAVRVDTARKGAV